MEQLITWLLVADSSKAKLYGIHKAKFLLESHPRHLNLVGTFTHEDSRKKTSDLVSDKMGSYGVGSFNADSDPKQNEAQQFAHELGAYLDIGRKDGQYRDLILVAPPHFMGLLHSNMSSQIKKMVTQTIEKDYTNFADSDLVANLIKHF